jgi:hypothetical protein
MIIALIAAGFVLLAVYLVSGYSLINGFDLSGKGGLGDAVNGLSAPFISFFSAILIYVTLKEQIKANKLLGAQNQETTLLNLFTQIEKQYNDLTIEQDLGEIPSITRVRDDAVQCFADNFHNLTLKAVMPFLDKLFLISEDMTLVVQLLQRSDVENKNYYYRRLYTLYMLVFGGNLKTIIKRFDEREVMKTGFERSIRSFNRLEETSKLLVVLDSVAIDDIKLKRGGFNRYEKTLTPEGQKKLMKRLKRRNYIQEKFPRLAKLIYSKYVKI